MSAHAVLVLAAGGSTRLGRPKQLLTRDGETLVQRAVRLAAATRPQRLVVVTGACDDEIWAALHVLERELGDLIERVRNPGWSAGIATSLSAAVDAMEGFEGAALILVCDQPALEEAHLQRLLAGARASPSGCAATRHGARLGVPAMVTPALLESARRMQGDAGLGAQLTAMPDVWVLDAPELALDIDTPQDVDAAVAKGWLDR